jgi:hypothetical protein
MRMKVLGESAVQSATAQAGVSGCLDCAQKLLNFAVCFCNALPVVWNWYTFWGGREPVIDVLELESAKKSGVGQPIRLFSEFQVATTNAGARTARRLDPRLFGALQHDAQPLTASLQVTLRLESTLLGAFVVSRRIRFG